MKLSPTMVICSDLRGEAGSRKPTKTTIIDNFDPEKIIDASIELDENKNSLLQSFYKKTGVSFLDKQSLVKHPKD